MISKVSPLEARVSSTHTSQFIASLPWYIRAMPLLIVLVLGTVGWLVYGAVERETQRQLEDQLSTLLRSNVSALRVWMNGQRSQAERDLHSPAVRTHAAAALMFAAGGTEAEESKKAAIARLSEAMSPILNTTFSGYFLAQTNGVLIHSSALDEKSATVPLLSPAQLEQLQKRETVFTAPVRRMFVREKNTAVLQMLVPLPAEIGNTQPGVIGLYIPCDSVFTDILTVARPGLSGETYAFDRQGWMISRSRFEKQLREIGLLKPGESSAMNVAIRDPGGNLNNGFKPELPRDQQPFTLMARTAVVAAKGPERVETNIAGYRDYRGEMVAGAWVWLPEFDIGVTTEQDIGEAYRSLETLRIAFGAIFVLLLCAAAGALLAGRSALKLRHRVEEVVEKMQQMGQYNLHEKIGEGGMGAVYRATHALLRRPTAIKLLLPERTNAQGTLRFEREVRLTCNLSHPNTIKVFDYGQTSSGYFYYAMEYLYGVSLQRLVDVAGPLPAGRVIYLLRQVCGSLREAHDCKLIHRDIKPANVLVCIYGGQFDFIKVLDFGLVKEIATESVKLEEPEKPDDMRLTRADQATGTPQFMPPEQFRNLPNVDERADLYSVGTVAYLLLTGTHVFSGTSFFDIATKHVAETPEAPSSRVKGGVPADLEKIVLRCLAKSPRDRYQSAEELDDALAACADAKNWSGKDAEKWWSDNAVAIDDVRKVLDDSRTTRKHHSTP